jgi:hypothetical protein
MADSPVINQGTEYFGEVSFTLPPEPSDVKTSQNNKVKQGSAG